MEALPKFDLRDDTLLQELRDVMAVAFEVPVSFAVAAKASFTWRTIDAELDAVSVCFDSAVDGQALVRGPAALAPRSLSFEGAVIGLEVEVRSHEICGQIVPPRPGVVRLRSAGGECQSTEVDQSGWFSFEPVPSGPHRFEYEADADSADGTDALTTEWTLI